MLIKTGARCLAAKAKKILKGKWLPQDKTESSKKLVGSLNYKIQMTFQKRFWVPVEESIHGYLCPGVTSLWVCLSLYEFMYMFKFHFYSFHVLFVCSVQPFGLSALSANTTWVVIMWLIIFLIFKFYIT